MILNENSIYTTDEGKQVILDDKERLAKLFVTTFLGFIALYGSGKRKQVLTSYLKSEKRLSLVGIRDDNNDLSLVVRMTFDGGLIRRGKAHEMTRLIYAMKKNDEVVIDENEIRALLEPRTKLVNELKGRFKSEFIKFIDGEQSVYSLIYRLRQQIRTDENLSKEFQDIFVRYLPQLKAKAGIKEEDEITDLPVVDVGSKPTVNIDKIKSDISRAEIESKEKEQPTSKATPQYDLTKRESIEQAFIEVIKADSPGKFLKSIGSSLGEFPWGKVFINNDIAYEYYKNHKTTKLSQSRLNAIDIIRVGGRHSDLAKNKDKKDTLFALGLVEAYKRKELNSFDFAKLAVELYDENSEAFFGFSRIPEIIKNNESEDSSIDLIIKMVNDAHFQNRKSFLDVARFYAGENIEDLVLKLIDRLGSYEEDIRFNIFKLILVILGESRRIFGALWYNSQTLDSLFSKYSNTFLSNVGTEELDTYFNKNVSKLVSTLEDNDYFDDRIREYRPKSIDDIDLTQNTSLIYNELKGIKLDKIPEEIVEKLLVYIGENNLVEDYIRSFPTSSNLADHTIRQGETSKHYYLKKIFGSSNTKNMENLHFLVGEYILRKSAKNIFTKNTYSYISSVLNQVKSLFETDNQYWFNSDKPSTRLLGVFSDLERENEEIGILVKLNDYISNLEIVNKDSSTGVKISGFVVNIDFEGVTPKSLVEFISNDGLLGLFGSRLDFSEPSIKTIIRDNFDPELVDGLFYTGFSQEFADLCLDEILKFDISGVDSKTLIKYNGFNLIVSVMSVLPNSSIEKISKSIDKLDEILNIVGKPQPKVFTTFLEERNMLDYSKLDDESLIRIVINSTTESSIESIIKELYERGGVDVFIDNLSTLDLRADSFSKVHSRLKKINADDADLFLDSVLDDSKSYAFYGLDGSNSSDVYINTTFYKSFTDKEDKRKVSNSILRSISETNHRTQNNIFKATGDVISSIINNCDESVLEEFADSGASPSVIRSMNNIILSINLSREEDLLNKIMNSDIKPITDLNEERFIEILRYNGISIANSSIRRKKSESYTEYMNRLKELNKDNFKLNELTVELEQDDELSLKRKSIEYNRLYTNGRHGDLTLKFLRSFSVSDDWTSEKYYDFKQEYNNSMYPVFHGTGSIAASMILRQGFAIIDQNDSSAVGRMLGNGIYFSNILDKAALYVSDSGYNRGPGQEGYILEMEAVLGDKNVDYKDAGINSMDGIRSPEWVIYNPEKQLSIKKAHHVVTISRSEIEKFESELNESGEYLSKYVTPLVGFKDWIQPIKESLNVDNTRYSCTFIFRDGNIVLPDESICSWRNANINSENVQIDSSQLGIAVTVYYDNDNIPLQQAYVIDGALGFKQENSQEYQIYKALLNNLPTGFEE